MYIVWWYNDKRDDKKWEWNLREVQRDKDDEDNDDNKDDDESKTDDNGWIRTYI